MCQHKKNAPLPESTLLSKAELTALKLLYRAPEEH